MSKLEIFLAAAVIIAIILPPKYDPAIRLKLWMIKKGWDRS